MQLHAHNDLAIGVEGINNDDRPPRRYSAGRLCGHPDCDTHLSVYNKTNYCALHQAGVRIRIRGTIL